MADNPEPRGMFGLILGAIVAIAAIIFLVSGGEHFGKKTVTSDADLPPVATGLPGPTPETTGGPSARRTAPARALILHHRTCTIAARLRRLDESTWRRLAHPGCGFDLVANRHYLRD